MAERGTHRNRKRSSEFDADYDPTAERTFGGSNPSSQFERVQSQVTRPGLVGSSKRNQEVLDSLSWVDRARYDDELHRLADSMDSNRKGSGARVPPKLDFVHEVQANAKRNYTDQMVEDASKAMAERIAAAERLAREPKVDPRSYGPKNNNGTFEWSEAGKNFVKGIISPFKPMFQDVPSFFKGVAIGVAVAATCIALPGLGTVLLAGGLVWGAWKAVKGIGAIAAARDGDAKERAFSHFGESAVTIAGSLVGLRQTGGALAAAQGGQISRTQAVVEAINHLPTTIKQSGEMLKSGQAWSNLQAAFPILDRPAMRIDAKGGITLEVPPPSPISTASVPKVIHTSQYAMSENTMVSFRTGGAAAQDGLAKVRIFKAPGERNLVVIDQDDAAVGGAAVDGLKSLICSVVNRFNLAPENTAVVVHHLRSFEPVLVVKPLGKGWKLRDALSPATDAIGEAILKLLGTPS